MSTTTKIRDIDELWRAARITLPFGEPPDLKHVPRDVREQEIEARYASPPRPEVADEIVERWFISSVRKRIDMQTARGDELAKNMLLQYQTFLAETGDAGAAATLAAGWAQTMAQLR